MPQHLLDDLDVGAAGDREACRGVSELVRVEAGHADRPGRGTERGPEGADPQRLAVADKSSTLLSVTFAGVVWACGQIPADEHGNVPEAIGDQVTVALDNLEQVLTAAGASLSSLLKLTIFLANLDEFDEFDEYNEAYQRRLAGHPLPPRTTVQVARFRGEKRIEIDAVAALAS